MPGLLQEGRTISAVTEDMFTRIFDLSDQSGPVNAALARELSHSLTGESQALNPWTTEELVELVKLAECHIAAVSPFSFPPALEIVLLDPRGWADAMVTQLVPVAEPFGSELRERFKGHPMLAPMGTILVSAQLGAWAGHMSRRVIGSCETGLPPVPGQCLLIATTVDGLAEELRVDGRQMRMWAALYQTAHRAVFSLPHVAGTYRALNRKYAESVDVLPEGLLKQLDMENNPSSATGIIMELDVLGSRSSIDNVDRDNLAAFLGVMNSMARKLVVDASVHLVPDTQNIFAARDGTVSMGNMFVGAPTEATSDGSAFLHDIEERFGVDAARRVWQPEGGLPNRDDIRDPVGWAAKVLLDESAW